MPLAFVGSVVRVLASALLMGVVIVLIRSWPLALVVVIGAAVYAIGLLVFHALDAEEWSIIRSGVTARG
jgi:hypothetical protein